MSDLKKAKMLLVFGIIIGFSIPVFVLNRQSTEAERRKKNILIDQERMRSKLDADPSLHYSKNLSSLPFKLEDFKSMIDKSD